MRRRTRAKTRPVCEHEPRLMADPAHPRYVKVECLRCGSQTGYATSPDEAWDAWRRGDTVLPHDLCEPNVG